MSVRGKIKAIQGMRFLFALVVVLFHLKPSDLGNPICPYGYIGVTFFFVLSGYLFLKLDTNNINQCGCLAG